MASPKYQPEEYERVGVTSSSTSYFSDPERTLDPSIFDGTHLKPYVREWILETIYSFLEDKYLVPDLWTRILIAGSGVSYQWAADRDPADLDIMMGVDYVQFRHANPAYAGLTDAEIGKMLNKDMFSELYPEIDGVSFGKSNFEVTVYINLGVGTGLDDIKFINPYAAYDVTSDFWAVQPSPNPMVRVHPSWDVSVETDRQRGLNIVTRYGKSLEQIRGAKNSAHRVNAERDFENILDAATALYEEIHAGRRAGFSPAGLGYADFTNYRWQSGKRSGVVQAMKRLKDYAKSAKERDDFETYGMELPDTETLVRRAATYRMPR